MYFVKSLFYTKNNVSYLFAICEGDMKILTEEHYNSLKEGTK